MYEAVVVSYRMKCMTNIRNHNKGKVSELKIQRTGKKAVFLLTIVLLLVTLSTLPAAAINPQPEPPGKPGEIQVLIDGSPQTVDLDPLQEQGRQAGAGGVKPLVQQPGDSLSTLPQTQTGIVADLSHRTGTFRFRPISTTTLAVSNLPGQPQGGGHQYVAGDGVFIDWNLSDRKWWFKWSSLSEQGVSSVVWQVSILPFPAGKENWANPPGLVASGILETGQNQNSLLFTDRHQFVIDFAKFAPGPQNTTTHLLKKNLFRIRSENAIEKMEAKPDVQANVPPTSGTTSLVDGQKTGLTKQSGVLQGISPSPDSGGVYFAAGTAGLGGIASELSSPVPCLTNQCPQAKDVGARILTLSRRTYYVRVVMLDTRGGCVGLPSVPRQVGYGKPVVKLAGSSATKLKVSNWEGRPSGEMQVYVGSDAFTPFVDWNHPDRKWWFKVENFDQRASHVVWQVTRQPFEGAGQDWETPSGLVASGKLKAADYPYTWKHGYAEFAIDFARFAPPPDPNNPQKFKYYVRAIPIVPSQDQLGHYTGYPSKTGEVNYGQTEVTQVTWYPPVEVTVLHPDVNILSYEPIRFEDPEWMYRFVVWKQPPHSPIPWDQFYHVGDKLLLKPQPEDNGFWDYVGDAFEAVVDFIESAVNGVSNAWDSIKGALIDFVAGAIPGCGDTCKALLTAGLNTGLAALGIPPDIPNFDQLCNMGVDYLAATIAEEAGIPPEVAKQGMEKLVESAEAASSGSGGAPGGLDFLKLDSDFQYRPGILTIELTNSHQEPTLPGTLTVENRDLTYPAIHNTYHSASVFRPAEIPIPSLKPGGKLRIPVFLVENNKYFNLNITNPLPLPMNEWLKMYHYGTTRFTVQVKITIDSADMAEQIQSPNGITFKNLGVWYKEKDYKLRPDLPSGSGS